MKNIYEVLKISIVSFDEDIITNSTTITSGAFNGDEHDFSEILGNFI